MHLTPRERQVLERLLCGDKRAAIAQVLGISPRTVRFHLEHVRERWGLHGTAHVLVFFARNPVYLGNCQNWQLTLNLPA
jgi:DNA-binding CsgD family transcriptional regulator